MAKKLKDINLLLAYQYEIRPKSNGARLLLLLLILEITIFILISSIYLSKIASVKNDVVYLNSLITQKEKSVSEVKNIIQQREIISQKENFINLKYQEHDKILRVLNELESITPANVLFENMSLSQDKFACIVKSTSVESLFQFILNLKSSSLFTNISFSSITGDSVVKTISVTANIVWRK